jgi:hypothetical protein
MGPLFGLPHRYSTLHDQRTLYRMRGLVFVPLHQVDFTPPRC